jgi:DNA-binding PadR family transcriptional regulator
MNASEGPIPQQQLFDATLLSATRLPIVVVLALYEEADFTFLKNELGMSDGNLGANLRKLEDEGFISCQKSFVGRKPRSLYALSAKGRTLLGQFIAMMKKVEQNMVQNRADRYQE